ncbi:hypothetical protein AAC978_07710 [Desulfitobacterium sp. THU1]|uniref:dual OB domain-containing protein n=1 Tax=Desulfitobacterium sp. THU1 TaxID=3138072 RepID=UPI00311D50B5
MQKDIVLLACSKKHNNYCVAGIDINNGEWIRVVSNNPHIVEAVTLDDMRYEDGTLPELLDILSISFLEHKPNYYQPENYLFDDSFYWERIGKANAMDVIADYATNEPEYLFYDANKAVESEFIQSLYDNEKYSLIAITPQSLKVHVKKWPEGKKVTMSFYYNQRLYSYLRVTDPDFEEEYLDRAEGTYSLGNNAMLVISLGENYHGAHYKLISGVIIP